MSYELVNDGIIESGASDHGVHSPGLATRNGPLSPLDEDMQRFGIDAFSR